MYISTFRNEKGAGKLQLISGLLLGMWQSAIGNFFPLSLVTDLEVFAKVNLVKFPSYFQSGELHGQGAKKVSFTACHSGKL